MNALFMPRHQTAAHSMAKLRPGKWQGSWERFSLQKMPPWCKENLQDAETPGAGDSLAGKERFRKLPSRFGVPFVVRLDIPDSRGAIFS